MRYGALLPHFGQAADRDRILEGAIRLQEYGFDSVWVRDHLLFTPHEGMETSDRTFLEALTVLTAVGAVADRLSLGTGTLIPTRHPLHVAQVIASMTFMFGARVIVGLGAGAFDHEFEAVGLGDVDRSELIKSYVSILRSAWTKDDFSYRDAFFEFSSPGMEPKPSQPVPIWYCGNSPASTRRAVSFCDGWMPGRISLPTLAVRIRMLTDLSAQSRRPRPTIAVIPPTSVGETRQDALEGINVEGLIAWANKAKYWVRPASGSFENLDDLEGLLIAGSPNQVVEACRKFESLGTDHLVFDLRFRFDRWFEQIDVLGQEVLPRLRKGTPASC